MAEPIEVLVDPELHDIRTVPHVTQVGADAAHHLLGAVAELAGHRVEAHRRAAVEGLQPGGAVGVSEGYLPRMLSRCTLPL